MSALGNYQPGDRIGRLTVVRRSHLISGGAIVWLLTCDCGRPARRTTGRLRYLQRLASCPTCRRTEVGAKADDILRRLWAATGSLYGLNAQRRIEVDVHDALVKEFGPVRGPELRLPIEVVDPTDEGDGDGEDIAPVGEDRAMTLEEVGQELGVTRERVRQIEVKALKKLRRVFLALASVRGDGAAVLREAIKAAGERGVKEAAHAAAYAARTRPSEVSTPPAEQPLARAA